MSPERDTDPASSPPPGLSVPALPGPRRAPQVPALRPPQSAAQVAAGIVVDLTAIVAVFVLALKGRVDGVYALLGILLLGGIRLSDLGAVLTGKTPTGGATGLLMGFASAIAARGGSALAHGASPLALALFLAPVLGGCSSALVSPRPELVPVAAGVVVALAFCLGVFLVGERLFRRAVARGVRGPRLAAYGLGLGLLLSSPLTLHACAGNGDGVKSFFWNAYVALCGAARPMVQQALQPQSSGGSGGVLDAGVIDSQ